MISAEENPKRQSLTHHSKPNAAAATPTKMQKNHKAQQKSESAIVLLKLKIVSRLRINIVTKSAIRFVRNNARPRSIPSTSPSKDGRRIIVENNPPPTQSDASSKSTFLSDGSLNSDE
jgi:hypothetical protein